jgi:hypothetical protein
MQDNQQQGGAVAAQTAAVPAVPANVDLSNGIFASVPAFETGQRMAQALARSQLVPQQYQNNMANCLIALDVSMRMRLSPMTVLQGLNVIQGKPSWGAQFVISAINASGLFSPLRFEFRGEERTDSWECRAKATDKQTGEELHGPWVGIAMAKREGWYQRSGSKWQSMPEQMMFYRAGAFFGRLYAGHILTGMTQTSDELEDTLPQVVDVTPTTAALPAAAAAAPASDADDIEARARGGNGRRRRRGAADSPAEPENMVSDQLPAGAPETAQAAPPAGADTGAAAGGADFF